MNGSAINPKRGIGFNKDGERLVWMDAPNARSLNINPYAVEAAVSGAIAEANDQVRNIMLDLYRIYGNASVVLNGVDLTQPEDDLENAIKSIPEYIEKNLSKLPEDAETVRNRLQAEYNEIIYSKMDELRRVPQEDENKVIAYVRYEDIGGSN